MRADALNAESERFRAIVEPHAAHLHDYCRALLTDRNDAAEAAQATLISAFSLPDRLQDSGRARAWLLTLARRECRSADPVRSWLLRAAPPASSSQDDEDARPSTAHGRRAAVILKALPTAEQEVLDLVYRHYLSVADVAIVLGEPAERASGLLSAAVASFERATQNNAGGCWPDVLPERIAGALLTGVRAISTIPLVALPPSVLARATSVVLDPYYRGSVAAAIGPLGPDGFPLPPPQPSRQGAQPLSAGRRRAVLQRAVDMSAGPPRRRLALLSVLLMASAAALAVLASSSSGMPNVITHAIGQALGQDAVGTPRLSIRGPRIPMPITALLPKKRDNGIILPTIPVAYPTSRGNSHKPRPTLPPPTVTPSATPTPTTPSPTPTTPSPTPTSPPPSPTATP